jgi:hypothetical protein
MKSVVGMIDLTLLSSAFYGIPMDFIREKKRTLQGF